MPGALALPRDFVWVEGYDRGSVPRTSDDPIYNLQYSVVSRVVLRPSRFVCWPSRNRLPLGDLRFRTLHRTTLGMSAVFGCRVGTVTDRNSTPNMLSLIYFVWLIVTPSLVSGFTTPRRLERSLRTSRTPSISGSSYRYTSSTAQNMILLGDELLEAVSSARGEFVLWFFGGSGAAGIALGQFPNMFKKIQYIQSLKGQGSTLGGDKLGLSPLCGYPEDLNVKDVEQVVNNPLSIEDMVKKFPNDGSFLAKQGYLTFTAFQAANSKANPLAVRAVFDTFAQSTDTCVPEIAERKLADFREDISRLNGSILASKVVGWLSIGVLLFLLGIAGAFAAGSVYNGWFPEWPGGRDFPLSLLDPNDGAVWNIPKYWI